MVRKYAIALVVVALVLGWWSPLGLAQDGPLLAEPTEPIASDKVPDGLTSSDWSSIRTAYEANRHAAYPVDGGHRARNPGQQWTTLFDGRGFLTSPDNGGWSWGLELVSWAGTGSKHAVTVPQTVTVEGQRVAYEWGDQLTEWYVNDPKGLEHGYTIHARPTGATGPLTLDLAIRGGLVPEVSADGRDVRFVDTECNVALTYAGLNILDAGGRSLPAGFSALPGGLRLTVDDIGACYPLLVDPIAQQAYLNASNAETNDFFGWAVAASGDTVVVGPYDEDSAATGVNGDQGDNSAPTSGAAYVFVRSGSTWSQQAYLKASNTEAGDRFGVSLAVSGDTIVIGAAEEDSNATGINGDQSNNNAPNAGAAYVFVRNGTTWSQQAYLKPSNTGAHYQFGQGVSISGDTIVIGASGESSFGLFSGAAYVFVRNGSTWSQQALLKADVVQVGVGFGASVSISGDTIVVGAILEGVALQSGAAYVYVRTGTLWSMQYYLKAMNPNGQDLFGCSVSISGDTIVVGASGEDSSATGIDGDGSNNSASASGAGYVFVRDGTTWTQQAYLKASNTDPGDGFGISVSVSGNVVVVGSSQEWSSAVGVNGNQGNHAAGLGSGAAYVFVRDGVNWSQSAYLKPWNTHQNMSFGQAVTVSADTVIIGAPGEDAGGTGNAGAAHVFYLDAPNPWTAMAGGTSGIAGPPVLTMSGALWGFSTLTLDLVDGPPSALAILFVSLSSTPTPFIGGTLHAFPYDELVIIGTDGAGEIHGSVIFPPVASGTELWFQLGMVDASVPIYGASLSNGVKGTVP